MGSEMCIRDRSLGEISRKDPRQRASAYSAMDQLIREFPDSPLTERVEFEKIRLTLETLPTAEATRQLEKIGVDDSNYPLAVFEKIRLQHRILKERREAKEDGERVIAAFNRLAALEKQHRQMDDALASVKLRATLLVLDAELQRQPGDEKVAEQLLAASLSLASGLPGNSSKELRYYEFRTAQKYNRQSTAMFHADWLAQNAKQTRYERAALIYLIRTRESLMFEPNADVDKLKELVQWVERLVAVVGSEQDDIRRSSNARAALIKLARLKNQTKDYQKANAIYETLLAVYPRQQNYLLESAKTKMNLNAFNEAGDIWRKPISGVDPGTDIWFESKFNLIECLRQSNESSGKDSARKLLDQTIALSGEMPEKWAVQFQQLEQQLKANR